VRYEQAVFSGAAGQLAAADRELDAAEAVAEQHLAESTRLRREVGLLPGAAPNMVGLAYIAAARGRGDDALALLDEAGAIAAASRAHRISQQVDEARAEISGQRTHGPG
jgi:hypothetical protein